MAVFISGEIYPVEHTVRNGRTRRALGWRSPLFNANTHPQASGTLGIARDAFRRSDGVARDYHGCYK